ncbi:MAG: histidine kinase, partial [Bacteroidetes bacterium]|nr:histidine kinase [Bacteroidota bacterium]
RLNDVGLVKSIEDVLSNMSSVRPLDVEFTPSDIDEEMLDDGLKLTIYRIVQEQTTNILKHAEATKVGVRLHRDNRFLELNICDNGKGFDTSRKRGGIGLANIKNRVSIYHGKVDLKSAPGKGCCLSVFFDISGGE